MEKAPEKFRIIRYPLILILIIALLFIEGCGGKKEVEQLGFIMGIGIDKGEQPDTYRYTIQIALPKVSGGAGTDIENWTITSEVKTLPETVESIGQTLNKQPFGGTTRVVVLGEDLARSGINEVIDSFERFYQYRRTIYLVLAKGKAEDILKTELRTKKLPSLNILGIIQGETSFSSFPITRLGHYLTILGRESQNPIIPVVQSADFGKRKIEYSKDEGKELLLEGAGVFDLGKLIDFLTDEETKGFMWLDNAIKTRLLPAEGENSLQVLARVHNSSTKFKVQPDAEGNMGIIFQIKAKAAISQITGLQQEMTMYEWKDFSKSLEPIVAQAIEKECQAAVEKSKKIHADFIGIGRKVEIKKPKYWQQVKEDWPNLLSNFPVSYDIQVTVEHTGLPQNSPVSPQENR